MVKSRYMEMAACDRVPLKILHEDSVGSSYDYAAMFVQKSLWLEAVLPKISISQLTPALPRIVVPLKGKAVTFSDDINTDLLLAHNNKLITLRFVNTLDRDAFAYMYVNTAPL